VVLQKKKIGKDKALNVRVPPSLNRIKLTSCAIGIRSVIRVLFLEVILHAKEKFGRQITAAQKTWCIVQLDVNIAGIGIYV
jgi:hypothetical protein